MYIYVHLHFMYFGLGTFAAKVALHSVIVQARTFSGRHYGNFFELSPGVFEIQKCVIPDVSFVHLL